MGNLNSLYSGGKDRVYTTEAVKIFGRVLQESDRAVKIQNALGQIAWLPKSQIRQREDIKDGRQAFYIPEWLAEKSGLV